MSQWLTSDVKPVYVEQFVPPRTTLMAYFIHKVQLGWHYVYLSALQKNNDTYRGWHHANTEVIRVALWFQIEFWGNLEFCVWNSDVHLCQWNHKVVRFCYIRVYQCTEINSNCLWLQMTWMKMDCNLGMSGPGFQVLPLRFFLEESLKLISASCATEIVSLCLGPFCVLSHAIAPFTDPSLN